MGLDYFGARYYDPEIGRWISTDPNQQYYDAFSYTGGNPVVFFDPSGKDAYVFIWRHEMGDGKFAQHAAIGFDQYDIHGEKTGMVYTAEFGPAPGVAVGIGNGLSNVAGEAFFGMLTDRDLHGFTGVYESRSANSIITLTGDSELSFDIQNGLMKSLESSTYNGGLRNCTDFVESGLNEAGYKTGALISQPEGLEKQIEKK